MRLQLIFCLLFCRIYSMEASNKGKNTFAKLKRFETLDYIARGGLPGEKHTVLSEDGYFLTLHRIPHNPHNNLDNSNDNDIKNEVHNSNFHQTPKNVKKKKPVVLLGSPFAACSNVWFVNSDANNLPFLLSRSGFDVWLSSARGCAYSRIHQTLNPNKPEFWNFGFHEMGIYDLPAVIDFILKETGQEKLNYIGQSMGTTVNLVLLSMKPEYNEKINMSINLAPVAFLHHLSSPAIRTLSSLAKILPDRLMGSVLTLGSQEFLPRSDLLQSAVQKLCTDAKWRKWCMALIFSNTGFDYCQLNYTLKHEDAKYRHCGNNSAGQLFEHLTMLQQQLTAFPSGTSAKTALHLAQLINKKGFHQFDYGPIQNLLKYQSLQPPEYPLQKIRAPQTLFWGENDWTSDSQDVATLGKRMRATKEVCRVRFSKWNHMDYFTAKDAHQLVNKRILRVLQGKSCQLENEDDGIDDESISCKKEQDDDDDDDDEMLEKLQQSVDRIRISYKFNA